MYSLIITYLSELTLCFILPFVVTFVLSNEIFYDDDDDDDDKVYNEN